MHGTYIKIVYSFVQHKYEVFRMHEYGTHKDLRPYFDPNVRKNTFCEFLD